MEGYQRQYYYMVAYAGTALDVDDSDACVSSTMMDSSVHRLSGCAHGHVAHMRLCRLRTREGLWSCVRSPLATALRGPRSVS